MVDFSILFSVAIALVLGFLTFGKQKLHFDNSSLIIWIWFYVVILIAAGLDYVIRQKKISGVLHALLMFGVGALGFYGATINHNLIGGGVDNPAAGIYALQTLVSLCFGILAAFCGVSVVRQVFAWKKKPGTPSHK